jgi:endogenous inhibitor of DNA gyrase (YacG/DUF329 family)
MLSRNRESIGERRGIVGYGKRKRGRERKDQTKMTYVKCWFCKERQQDPEYEPFCSRNCAECFWSRGEAIGLLDMEKEREREEGTKPR